MPLGPAFCEIVDVRFTGTKEIKEHVIRVLHERSSVIIASRAVDFPAGNGVTSHALKQLHADVVAVDLFPELFRGDGVELKTGDLSQAFPLETNSFDFAVCQEGIEHVGNQDHVFREFARILKTGGRLLLTTPNYSNLKSKMSYLLTESEAFGRIMPPNEHDSIWLAPQKNPESVTRIYFGHVFLTGFFRIRLFAKLAGFKLLKVHDSRVNSTSLILFPLLFPLIVLNAWRTKRRFVRKTGKTALANDLFQWLVSPKILLENHLILEFEKANPSESPLHQPENADLGSYTT